MEEQSFADSVTKIGGSQIVDQSLSLIMNRLCNKPEQFDLIPGYEPIRIARTIMPVLRVWFVIVDDETIKLLYVDEVQDEE